MKHNNPIEELFRKGFRNFEATPREENWQAIKKELANRQQKKPVPLWYKIAGVAAALVFIFTTSYFFWPQRTPSTEVTHSKPQEKEPATEKQINPLPAPINSGSVDSAIVSSPGNLKKTGGAFVENSTTTGTERSATNYINEEQTAQKATNTEDTFLKKPQESKGDKKNLGIAPNFVEEQKQPDRRMPSSEKTRNQLVIDLNRGESHHLTAPLIEKKIANKVLKNGPGLGEQDSLESKKSLVAVAQQIQEEEPNLAKTSSREGPKKSFLWSIKPNFSPVLLNSLGGGNALDPSLSQVSSKGNLTFSYGIDVAYALSDRLKIRSGVRKVNLSYTTQNISFTPSISGNSMAGVIPTTKSRNIRVLEGNVNPMGAKGSSIATSLSPTAIFSGDISQQIGFIEVPVEVEYALIDERFKLNIIGGTSTLFVSENRIQIESKYGTTPLGKSSKLNSTSFTANIGLGFGYSLTQQLQLNIEPTFKYQINTFSGTENFNPYYLGISTGISFHF